MKKYKVTIYGYGAEVTIGSVDEEQKTIINNPDKELWEIVTNDLEDWGSWYEIDDQYHRWGASGTFTILIEDENGEEMYKIDSDNLSEFDTEEFQLWSMNNPDSKIKDTMTSYKWPAKDYIFDYTKDSNYRDTKLKVGSLRIGSIKCAIDENFKYEVCYVN